MTMVAGPATAEPITHPTLPDAAGEPARETAPANETAPASDPTPAAEATPIALVALGVARTQIGRLLAEESAVRRGDDVEAVHRMRVASRRLRTALRLFEPWLAPDLGETRVASARGALRSLATALGHARDADVLRETLRSAAGRDDQALVERLLVRQANADSENRAAVVAALDGGAFQMLRDDLAGAVADALDRPRIATDQTVGEAGPAVVAAALKKLRRCDRVLGDGSRAGLHRTRIRAKRLRYAGEFLGPWFGPSLRDCTTRARAIQDALGAYLDAEHAADALLDALRHAEDWAWRAADASGGARLLSACQAQTAERRRAFAELWPGLPRPSRLRRQLMGEAR